MRLIIFLAIIWTIQSCTDGTQQSEPFKTMLANSDEVNINFYNGGDTIKFDTNDSLGVKVLSESVSGNAETIKDTCQPAGQLFYRAKGDTLFRAEFADAEFILENGKYICGVEVEKMSKSYFNVVNPDVLIASYGADTLRMYEMFLGPLEQSKPWNTNGIEGVFKFLRKFWRLFHNDSWEFMVSDAEPSKAELKALHKIIKKVQDDIERFSFNTSVSSFMIAVNELTDLKCNKRSILQDLVVVLSPYAPHITEELWSLLGNEGSLSYAAYPEFNPAYLVEDEFSYPVSVNGKTRLNLNLSLALEAKEIEEIVLADEQVQKYLEGKTPKKVIIVKGRIVNIVI